MKKRLFKTMCILIALCSLLGGMSGCAKTENETKLESTVSPNTETTAVETEPEVKLYSAVPYPNFGGRDYRMFLRTEWEDEFAVDAENGEVLNDAVYLRNRAVEDNLNIKITIKSALGSWDNQEFSDALRNAINAGEDAYDIAGGYGAKMPGNVTEGIFLNLLEVPHIDLTQSYWSNGLVECFTINGKCYVASGALSLYYVENIFAMYFNKTIAENQGITGLYDMVKKNEWTFDMLLSYTEAAYVDLNGDGKRDDGDSYGYVSNIAPTMDMYADAFDVRITEKGDDGMPYFTLNTERSNEVYDRLNTFFWKTDGSYINADQQKVIDIFASDRALFIPLTFGQSMLLRDMESDFGIIPIPKYDVVQEKYQTTVKDDYTSFAIPITVQDAEFVGSVTEELSAASYAEVTPKFYEVVMKHKNVRDNDSAEMLDILYNGVHFDFAYTNSLAIDWAGHMFAQSLHNKRDSLATYYASRETQAVTLLEKLLAFYQE